MVSGVGLAPAGEAAPAGALVSEKLEGAWVQALPAEGRKCPRCWLHRTDGGRLESHPEVCARCAGVLDELGVELDAE